MLSVLVTISKFTDEHFPGFVECQLVDAHGRTWTFNEKVPVVSNEVLWADSQYPKQGSIACSILRRGMDSTGRQIITVDISSPWWIESPDGATVFDVLPEQLTDANARDGS